MDEELQQNEWMRKLKTLNRTVWDNNLTEPSIKGWLDNFKGLNQAVDVERHHSLHLLQQFMFFGAREVRELVRTLYRDLYRYPLLNLIREQNGNTLNSLTIEHAYQRCLACTRFIGVGGPSESGDYIMYLFRTENKISTGSFRHTSDLLIDKGASGKALKEPNVRYYVFVDDFSGTGIQARDRLKQVIGDIHQVDKNIQVAYLPLFATSDALSLLRRALPNVYIRAVMEFDRSYRFFNEDSIYFRSTDAGSVSATTSRSIAEHYGRSIVAQHPLGFYDCQLLIGFAHNVPDNSLPIFWYNERPKDWRAIFPRANKTEPLPNP
jgi:hypothetical protein